ncbi:hypothetical protein SynA18461_00382 [Synechococcus sp. A18-46.1]|nr:hypothetical protein SynA18461_00382 [Synechococcus sp. A18-46.1]
MTTFQPVQRRDGVFKRLKSLQVDFACTRIAFDYQNSKWD